VLASDRWEGAVGRDERVQNLPIPTDVRRHLFRPALRQRLCERLLDDLREVDSPLFALA
jgi:hypothetical protein